MKLCMWPFTDLHKGYMKMLPVILSEAISLVKMFVTSVMWFIDLIMIIVELGYCISKLWYLLLCQKHLSIYLSIYLDRYIDRLRNKRNEKNE